MGCRNAETKGSAEEALGFEERVRVLSSPYTTWKVGRLTID